MEKQKQNKTLFLFVADMTAYAENLKKPAK